MTGQVMPRSRMRRQVVKPSIRGIITSMMTRSGASRSAATRPSAPSSA